MLYLFFFTEQLQHSKINIVAKSFSLEVMIYKRSTSCCTALPVRIVETIKYKLRKTVFKNMAIGTESKSRKNSKCSVYLSNVFLQHFMINSILSFSMRAQNE